MTANESRPHSPELKLLVRMGTGFINFLHLQVRGTNTVQSVQEIIEYRLGIPISEQLLYYGNKKLLSEYILEECSIDNDAKLKLLDMRKVRDVAQNPAHEEAWKELHAFLFLIDIILTEQKDEHAIFLLKDTLNAYLETVPLDDDDEKVGNHIKIFTSSAALQGLINLSKSKIHHHELCAQDLISILLKWIKQLPPDLGCLTVPILLDLCLNFCQSWHEYKLNTECLSTLGNMMKYMSVSKDTTRKTDIALKALNVILRYIVKIMGAYLADDEVSSPLNTDVTDFKNFLLPVKELTMEGLASQEDEDIIFLQGTLSKLITHMDICLNDMELAESFHVGCYQHTVILYELQSVAHLFQSIDEELWVMLRRRKIMFNHLVINHSRRKDNNEWIFKYKELTTFECRRHLALLLFPKLNNIVELPSIEIKRSKVLKHSFTRITNAEKNILQAGLPLKFKDEEATGPGVVREWFSLICHVLFDPQRDFFISCPDDRRRFFPKSDSKVEREYFKLAGRVVALALMHKVQIGIVLDRVLCLQLAERSVSLEDIQDIDPMVYKSCKIILNMDPERVDEDILALTFSVEEKDESGCSTRVVDLVHGGANIVVDSKNRGKYVDLVIQHRFVKSVREHVDQFTKGFNDIISSPQKRKLFFKWLELEDLDKMLHGTERAISIEDWKHHTNYNGYQETDNQIVWFWEIIEKMSAEQRKLLLFFWTSIKYLPVEGFGVLSYRLSIHRRNGVSLTCLPTSHTCYNQLCFPPYSSLQVMEECLNTITLEHIACGFGEH